MSLNSGENHSMQSEINKGYGLKKTLTPLSGGSNPSTPANKKRKISFYADFLFFIAFFSLFLGYIRNFYNFCIANHKFLLYN